MDSIGEDEVEEGFDLFDRNKIVIDFNAHTSAHLLKKQTVDGP